MIATLMALLSGGCGLLNSGGFLDSTPPGPACQPMGGFVGGTEDIAPGPEPGSFFVSSGDYKTLNGAGAIYLVRVAGGRVSAPVQVSSPIPSFNPHGIDYWTDGVRRRLFVVNHPTTATTTEVLIFDVDPSGRLTFDGRRRAFPGALWRANDIVAIGPDSFYATNDLRSRQTWGDPLELLFGWRRGHVVLVNEAGEISRAAEHIGFANGIALSSDGRTLYVAESLQANIVVYGRDPATNRLTLRRRIAVGPGPDNLYLRSDRELWYAGHNNALKLLDHRRSGEPSPSRVEKIDPTASAPERVPIFQDDGSQLSAISVGLPADSGVLVGAILTGKVALCPVR